MTYLFYDKENSAQYIEHQQMLIELIENSKSKEEKEYFERALMIFIMFGEVWV